ncbi:MAG: VTT domain-containing protein [Ardenticatenaceae bacterium]|nr:VTT domain-containing protein [Ardenticatenaceae bacterium]HBY99223.1 hypothetical protein [Chloroflexota bacterium]
MSRRRLGSLGVLLVAGLLGVGLLWTPLTRLTASLADVRAWVTGLGPLGPLGLIVLQIAQILVAPIPGYPVAVAAGVLFGGFWGGLYSTLGMLLGAGLAAGLSRRFGRPLLERVVARPDLRRWEPLVLNGSPWFWFLAVFLPTGEIPYFLAGLSRVPIAALLLAILAARGPTMFLIAAFAARASEVPFMTVVIVSLPLLTVAAILFWQREALAVWATTRLTRAAGPALQKID